MTTYEDEDCLCVIECILLEGVTIGYLEKIETRNHIPFFHSIPLSSSAIQTFDRKRERKFLFPSFCFSPFTLSFLFCLLFRWTPP